MMKTTVKIINPVGLHARPAAIFVETAQRYESNIQVDYGDQTADAKSILGILMLGVSPQSDITIVADGEDAEQALQALEQLVETDFAVSSEG